VFSEGTATVTTEIGDRKTVRVFEDIGGVSFGEYTPEQLEQEQEQDPDFKFLLDWLKHGEEPKEGLLFLSSQNAKFYWVNRPLHVRRQTPPKVMFSYLLISAKDPLMARRWDIVKQSQYLSLV
jgi:hypothetical protein